MAPNIQDIQAKADEFQAALDAEQQEVADYIATQEAAIAALQVLVAEGGTPEQRQAVVDTMTTAIEDLKTTIPNLPPPSGGAAK